MKIKVRCDNCDRLLGEFEEGDGEIKCPRCSHMQKIKV
jgi:phage FluMu protein Com